MTRYLLDTNIVISLIKNEYPELTRKIQNRDAKEFAVSSITYAELVYGYERLQEAEKLKKKLIVDLALSVFTMFDFDKASAIQYGKIKSSLRSKNAYSSKNELDLQIAAVAQANGLTLLTKNLKDFQHIDSVKIIGDI